MLIRYKNARLWTGLEERPFAGELWTRDDKVEFAGAAKDAPSPLPAFEEEADCGGNLLLPGFKNAHAHSAMTFLRSRADDLPLKEWLFNQVFPYERRLREEDVYWLTRLAILEYVSGGITSIFDMYYHRDAFARACIDSGFRATVMGCANDFGGSAEETEGEYLHFNGLHPLINYRLGFHAEYTTSEDLLKSLAGMVDRLKQPFYTHLNETASEVEECVARYGLRPIEKLDSLGLFDYGGGGFHCVHLSPGEMDIMARRGLTAVTCPGSNCKLGSGIAPVTELMERGVAIAIGTDGPASNNCLDMFREMFLLTGLQKVLHGPEKADAMSVLRMACLSGAEAMGLPQCRALVPGNQADFILVDLDQPNMRPFHELLKNLVYSGSKSDILMTVVAGKVLYRKGEYFVGEDREEIYRRAEDCTAYLTRS